MYEILILIMKYVFTLIIYLFIFNIAKLIYQDIKTITTGEDAKALMPHLALLAPLPGRKGEVTAELYPLVGPDTSIGRGQKCDIVLTDPHVSTVHAMIQQEKDHFFIDDKKSANGTFINAHLITDRTELNDGDRITLGGQNLLFSKGGK
jgi:pSer/pThr/pTyr-binding forkhead associated (FHA) protein